MGPTNFGLLTAGVLLTFFVGFTVSYALPLFDDELASGSEFTRLYSDEERAGKSLYDSEGCVYCHTQSVRPVLDDVGLGVVTGPDAIASDGRAAVGLARVGPDLACVGDRISDGAELTRRLTDPRADRPRSNMPSYRYLSDEELQALVAYLQSLTCEA